MLSVAEILFFSTSIVCVCFPFYVFMPRCSFVDQKRDVFHSLIWLCWIYTTLINSYLPNNFFSSSNYLQIIFKSDLASATFAVFIHKQVVDWENTCACLRVLWLWFFFLPEYTDLSNYLFQLSKALLIQNIPRAHCKEEGKLSIIASLTQIPSPPLLHFRSEVFFFKSSEFFFMGNKIWHQ